MQFASLRGRLNRLFSFTRSKGAATWSWYKGRKRWQQVAIAGALLAIIIALFAVLGGAKPTEEANALRAVTLESVGSLSGNGSGVGVIGTVRSVSEADIIAQSGGTVRRVNTALGSYVRAGAVIAELENAAERASVLQAEGTYDAAVAARNAVSPDDSVTTVRNSYRTAFTAVEVAFDTQVDLFFGEPTATGPRLLIDQGPTQDLSRKRDALDDVLDEWRETARLVNTRDPQVLLDDAESKLRTVSAFLNELSLAANARNSRATDTQISALASARSTVNTQLSAIASARSAYRSQSTSATASVDAGVKQALGALRAAQANLERTIVRAPIAGQVNYLPIRVGDYVTALSHVATVAQNGSLEIVAFVSEADRELLTAGTAVTVEGQYEGIITSIAPALDPTTKQIEIRIAVNGGDTLVNGQSVRISLPNTVAAPVTEVTSGPIMLPLSSVKLQGDARIVFTLSEEGRLSALNVEVGEVRGDRIEVRTPLAADLLIVKDARGLSDGQRVRVAN